MRLILVMAVLLAGCSASHRLCRQDDLTDSQKLDCIGRRQNQLLYRSLVK